jgi:error-prone DNA polymerase
VSSSAYAALWVKSCFSFLEGASHPEELVETAHRLGLSGVAMTDRDGIYGVVRAHVKARELGQPLLVGAELSVVTREHLADDGATPEHAVLLAGSREGYAALCALLSRARLRCEKGRARATPEELCLAGQESRGGLLALLPAPALFTPLADAFAGALYALAARHRIAGEDEPEARLRRAAKHVGAPVVAGVEVLYHTPARRPLQDVLTCTRLGTTLRAAGTRLRPNAEHDLKSDAAMRALFADDPAALQRTREVAERARFSLAELRYRYPSERLPETHGELDWLRELTYRGARVRYDGEPPDAVRAQLEKELALIAELDFGGYFLTMWEIVEECRRRGILCQGRGSAANSAVCFCLGITAVDPVKMDLLFERFLSRERAEPPDIDLDMEHERREEILQWVYERYGRRHAAMVANVIRYRPRSAVRDVGKALGLPITAMDQLSKLLGHHAQLSDDALRGAGLDPEAPAVTLLKDLSTQILDFPRHLSIHPGGFLLGHEPVDTLVPIEPATMEGRTVIQWDKYDVEALGLFKVDLLALGALTVVERCFRLLRTHHGLDLDMARVPPDDPGTWAMCARGDTVGVFQIESRAQMAMLPRLRPRVFYDLVVQVAIVRPGPIQGDMVHPYLRRRDGLEPIELPHPDLERVLMRTLGVPIFQEQVMKLAVVVGGYTGGEADQLRRDMAAWRSSGRIEAHHDRLVSRMIAHGIEPDFAERVFSQIRGFGEYGFPESHAASFALIAYVTAWLKRNHPAAFACALLNAQPMGFYAPSTILEDAKRRGIEVRPIAIDASEWDCTLEDCARTLTIREDGGRLRGGPAIRMGLRYVRGLGVRERERLEAARLDGPFRSVDDVARRTGLSARALLALGEAGAFEPLGVGRRDALWTTRGHSARRDDALPLADESAASFAPLTPGEEILWDYRASAHSTRGHPMMRFRPALTAQRIPSASELLRLPDGARTPYVGYVICRQRPGTASGVVFFTLEDETGFVNAVVWSRVFEEFEVLARTAGLLGITGRIQSQQGVVHLVAERLFAPRLGAASPPPTPQSAPRSRDFH